MDLDVFYDRMRKHIVQLTIFEDDNSKVSHEVVLLDRDPRGLLCMHAEPDDHDRKQGRPFGDGYVFYVPFSHIVSIETNETYQEITKKYYGEQPVIVDAKPPTSVTEKDLDQWQKEISNTLRSMELP